MKQIQNLTLDVKDLARNTLERHTDNFLDRPSDCRLHFVDHINELVIALNKEHSKKERLWRLVGMFNSGHTAHMIRDKMELLEKWNEEKTPFFLQIFDGEEVIGVIDESNIQW